MVIPSLPAVGRRSEESAFAEGGRKEAKQDEAAAQADRNGLSSRRGPEFSQNRGDMELRGVLRNLQAACNLLVSQATRKHLQNLAFARCQRLRQPECHWPR